MLGAKESVGAVLNVVAVGNAEGVNATFIIVPFPFDCTLLNFDRFCTHKPLDYFIFVVKRSLEIADESR